MNMLTDYEENHIIDLVSNLSDKILQHYSDEFTNLKITKKIPVIVFIGSVNSGKSTLAKIAAEAWNRDGIRTTYYPETGGLLRKLAHSEVKDFDFSFEVSCIFLEEALNCKIFQDDWIFCDPIIKEGSHFQDIAHLLNRKDYVVSNLRDKLISIYKNRIAFWSQYFDYNFVLLWKQEDIEFKQILEGLINKFDFKYMTMNETYVTKCIKTMSFLSYEEFKDKVERGVRLGLF